MNRYAIFVVAKQFADRTNVVGADANGNPVADVVNMRGKYRTFRQGFANDGNDLAALCLQRGQRACYKNRVAAKQLYAAEFLLRGSGDFQ
ncbi:hypothetical protein B1808_13600 [Pseudofulvimonas gallinarii]|nr:hypothetical protein B1808_13600 [Pseudofulvimonas gallinarii]